MKPIEKFPTYLLQPDGFAQFVECYTNSQLDFLHTYPYGSYQYSPTGGVFGRSNTDRVQVYVNRTVKYIL